MKETGKRILIAFAAVTILAVIAFLGLYFTRIQTMDSIEQLTDYPDGYNLYRMDVKYDYSLDDVIGRGITDDQSFVNAVIRESLNRSPSRVQ